MSQSPTGRALVHIAQEHSGNTVLNLVFGREVAGDRAIRFATNMASSGVLPHVVIDAFVFKAYRRPGVYSQRARRMLTGAIPFLVTEECCVHDSDVLRDSENKQGGVAWCVLDVRVSDPSRIIPATILVPYPNCATRLNKELDRTDMLPLWFRNSDGTLGVPIAASGFDGQSPEATRIEATSLKVAFWWPNYGPIEKQIQVRSKPLQDQLKANASFRRLASLISGAVRNAMTTYESMSVGRTEWQDRRWKIGMGSEDVSIHDVILLGVVFVSPGRVMPLLKVRPDFVFAASRADRSQ